MAVGAQQPEVLESVVVAVAVDVVEGERKRRASPAVEAAVMNGLQRDLSKRSKSVDEFARGFCTAVRDEGGQKGGFLANLFRKGPR